jgi:ribosomal silencing factor RsfS
VYKKLSTFAHVQWKAAAAHKALAVVFAGVSTKVVWTDCTIITTGLA